MMSASAPAATIQRWYGRWAPADEFRLVPHARLRWLSNPFFLLPPALDGPHTVCGPQIFFHTIASVPRVAGSRVELAQPPQSAGRLDSRDNRPRCNFDRGPARTDPDQADRAQPRAVFPDRRRERRDRRRPIRLADDRAGAARADQFD